MNQPRPTSPGIWQAWDITKKKDVVLLVRWPMMDGDQAEARSPWEHHERNPWEVVNERQWQNWRLLAEWPKERKA